MVDLQTIWNVVDLPLPYFSWFSLALIIIVGWLIWSFRDKIGMNLTIASIALLGGIYIYGLSRIVNLIIGVVVGSFTTREIQNRLKKETKDWKQDLKGGS